MSAKRKVPAVEGLFTIDAGEPRLLGSRCGGCGSYFFPPQREVCRNPGCSDADLTEVALSRLGRLWSYTSANYKPPPPFVADEPFESFAIAAVELQEEGLTVLGQVAQGVTLDELHTGMGMELVLETLYEDAERTYLTWKWRPVEGMEAS